MGSVSRQGLPSFTWKQETLGACLPGLTSVSGRYRVETRSERETGERADARAAPPSRAVSTER